MKNGQLKDGYSIQIASQNQFIVGYELYQRPGDTRCFRPFMEKLLNSLLKKPKQVVADAGYGVKKTIYLRSDLND